MSAITINVRYSTGTYVARAKGHKVTASCTIKARNAAEALARKLGLDPEKMRYLTDLGGKHFDTHVFEHEGEPDPNYCRQCAVKISACNCAEPSPVYWKTDRVMIDPYDGGTFTDQLRTFEVPRELLALAVSIPTKESVEKNEKAIKARGEAQATIRTLLSTGRVAR